MILNKPIQVNSPYLSSHDRLAKVIAAIQAMGTYKYYKRDITHWTIQITGNHNAKEEWTKLFKEHPEFFQVVKAEEKIEKNNVGLMASLVWRRSYPLTYNVNTEVKITPAEYTALSKKEQDNYSRVILSNEDIATLINTATNLHTQAIQLNQERRWWLPTMIGLSTAVVAVLSFIVNQLWPILSSAC